MCLWQCVFFLVNHTRYTGNSSKYLTVDICPTVQAPRSSFLIPSLVRVRFVACQRATCSYNSYILFYAFWSFYYSAIFHKVFKPALIYGHASVLLYTPSPCPLPLPPSTCSLQSRPLCLQLPPQLAAVVVLDINYAKCCLHL